MKISTTLLALAVSMLLACGGSQQTEDKEMAEQPMESEPQPVADPAPEPESTAETAPGEHDHSDLKARCPMYVEGTEMAVEETAIGVSLVFTNADKAAEVRDRTMKFAAHHSTAMEHHGSPLGEFSLTASETAEGAQLTLVPPTETNVEIFKEQIRGRMDAQGDRKCPMKLLYDMGDMGDMKKESDESA